jgi:hypothetical protein
MSFWHFRIRPLAWLRSLHAKLFVLLGLVTSVLTLAVAYNIIRNSRRELESYSRRLVIETAGTVETDVVERDPTFKDPDKLDQLLESIAGPDRSIFQIDVFKRVGRGTEVELVRSSGDESIVEWGPEIGSYLSLPGPQAELVDLEPTSPASLPSASFAPTATWSAGKSSGTTISNVPCGPCRASCWGSSSCSG